MKTGIAGKPKTAKRISLLLFFVLFNLKSLTI